MRLLLDTHALVWMLRDDPRLSRAARAAIDEHDCQPIVSAVSGYEICLKHALGKWPDVASLAADFERELVLADCVVLPVALAHALTAGKLDLRHRDPFDRLLIAQALVERVPIVSNEAMFDGFGVERVW